MITKARSLLLAATLMAAPIAAMAQPTPAVNNPSASGTSTTVQPSYGANPSSPNMNSSSAATNPNVPGATGQTVVKGSTSSMAGSNRVNPDPNAAATSITGGGGK